MDFINQLSEFINNHIYLVGSFVVLLGLLIFTESRRGGQSVGAREAVNLINRSNAVIIDLRDRKKYDAGRITNARSIPYAGLQKQIPALEKDKDRPLLLVCDSGQSAGAAARVLKKEGFDTYRLSGGMMSWTGDNLPVVR